MHRISEITIASIIPYNIQEGGNIFWAALTIPFPELRWTFLTQSDLLVIDSKVLTPQNGPVPLFTSSLLLLGVQNLLQLLDIIEFYDWNIFILIKHNHVKKISRIKPFWPISFKLIV